MLKRLPVKALQPGKYQPRRTMDDDKLAEVVTMLRTHGWKKKYFPEMLGYNSRLDEMQAAILRVKLSHVDAWNARRREIVEVYNTYLGAAGIAIPAAAAAVRRRTLRRVIHFAGMTCSIQ